MAPILEPELKMPVARALSFLGNHSAVVLIAAGKLPDSVKPKAALATKKPRVDFTKACPIAAILQATIATAYPSLLPHLSIRRPTPSSPMAYDTWKAMTRLL